MIPASGTFLGRDPFAGFERMPYSLHPYQYAYSSPANWTDPSGECVREIGPDGKPLPLSPPRQRRCERIQNNLADNYGVDLEDIHTWQYADLGKVIAALNDLIGRAVWSKDVFRAAMTARGARRVILRYVPTGKHVGSATDNPSDSVVKLAARAFTGSPEHRDYVIVHEFAHVWDYAHDKELRNEMSLYVVEQLAATGCPESPASRYGGTNEAEDWAEAVTAMVYPDMPRFAYPDKTVQWVDNPASTSRQTFVEQQFTYPLP